MRPRTTGPRALAALALLPAGLLAAGCGIQSTDVIAVGGPASAQAVPPDAESGGTVLFFAGPDGLMPVLRSVRSGPQLSLLFAGPTKAEAAAGIRTELPPSRGAAKMSLARGMVTVALDQDVAGLTPLAQQQIACTVLQSVAPGTDLKVTITGTDDHSSLSPLACPAG
ncbi:hypothetical protein ACFPFX_36935 [Streptomyces mauvecolor]|uniref:GerMN domain-containing protein n=1 Tax=Streptomyces mauvecolor TaxID=58345 RepID=A0ABV9V120_9ACTN